MAVTVKNLQDTLGERFQLRLLAGSEGINAVVTWVQMMENTSTLEFFWGNEVVVTSCYANHEEKDLLAFINELNTKRCAALVINVGQYIHEIPASVIRLCEESELPLFTMPWKMSIIGFVRAACTALIRSTVSEEDLAQAVIRAVNAPQEPGGYYSQLSSFFDEENGFRMVALRVKSASAEGREEKILDQRSILRLHTALRIVDIPYLIFMNDERFFVLLNTREREPALMVARNMLEKLRNRLSGVTISLGIGSPTDLLSGLSDAYHSALSAQRCARLQGEDMVEFSEMGFYRLLYSVPNDDLLRRYYYDTVGVLIDYDTEHKSSLLDTLFCYLMYDCSQTRVAEEMYTHRNTINYRIGKIRELTGTGLDTPSGRLPYMLAYHIGLILKIIKPIGEK